MGQRVTKNELFSFGRKFWSKINQKIQDSAPKEIGGRNLLRYMPPQRQKGRYSIYNAVNPIVEGTYTLSFNVEVITPPIGGKFLALIGYRPADSDYLVGPIIPYVEGKKRHFINFTIKKLSDKELNSPSTLIYLYPNNDFKSADTPNCGEAIFSDVKLERGSIATDYTEAPEEMETKFAKNTDVDNKISEALQNAGGAQTESKPVGVNARLSNEFLLFIKAYLNGSAGDWSERLIPCPGWRVDAAAAAFGPAEVCSARVFANADGPAIEISYIRKEDNAVCLVLYSRYSNMDYRFEEEKISTIIL